MTTGDITNPKRVRTQANERLDTGDASALSATARSHLDAYARAIEAAPRNVGTTTPTGLIFEGFGLTLNPSAPNDNKVRVQSPVGVAFDSNGRMLIKEVGVTVDLTLGAGNSQIYAYYIEDNSDSAVRRFISVTSPYVESGAAIPTTLKSDVAYWVRTGDQTSIVATDVVNGQTTPLCFLGVANNTAGAITMTGYDVVNAPNGAYAVNRITSILAPTTPPPANTANGSIAHIHGLLSAALYAVGQVAWAHSDFLTPSAANNFGAYKSPAGGADKAFRQALGYVTIGNGSTVFGDFNSSDYANSNALLTAALAGLPTAGGTIFLKKGVALTGFNTATINLPAKSVEIRGDGAGETQLTFVASEGLVCNAAGALKVRDLVVKFVTPAVALSTSPVSARDCTFNCTSTTDQGAALQGTTIADVELTNVKLITGLTTETLGGMLLRATNTADRIRTVNISHTCVAKECGCIQLDYCRDDIEIRNITMDHSGGSVTGILSPVVKICTLDNNPYHNRLVDGITCRGDNAAFAALQIGDFGLGGSPNNFDIKRVDAAISKVGVNFDNGAAGAFASPESSIRFDGCIFANTSAAFSLFQTNDSNFNNVVFRKCIFDSLISINPAGTFGSAANVIFEDCQFNTTPNHIISGEFVTFYMRRCRFDSLGNASAADTWCFKIQGHGNFGGNVAYVELVDNIIESFQNVTYVGGDSTTSPRIFDVRAGDSINGGGSIAEVICSRNEVRTTMIVAGTNTTKSAYLLRIDAVDAATNQQSFGTVITMVDNKIGDGVNGSQQSSCGLLLCQRTFPYVVNINDNIVFVKWESRTGHVQMADLIHIVWPTAFTGTARYFSCCDNKFYVTNVSASNISKDILFLQGTGGMAITVFQLENNLIEQDNAAFGFVQNSTPGFDLGAGITITNLIIQGNIAGNALNLGGGFCGTVWGLTPGIVQPTNPGSGNPWTLNLQFQSNN